MVLLNRICAKLDEYQPIENLDYVLYVVVAMLFTSCICYVKKRANGEKKFGLHHRTWKRPLT
eukprot:1584393-Karenia_brevis.AAC.1